MYGVPVADVPLIENSAGGSETREKLKVCGYFLCTLVSKLKADSDASNDHTRVTECACEL